MVKRSRGTLSRQTKKLKGKGKATVAQKVRKFEKGQKVVITPKAIIEGMPHPRYNGRYGIIVGQQGKAYIVEIKDFNKKKRLIATSVHLTAVQ